MKRVAIILAMTMVCGAGVARAQTPAGTSDQSQWYAEITLGPTFGHKTSGSIGAEAGYRLTDTLNVFGEAGRMQNVATSDLESNAQLIAGVIGATASAKRHVTYFDAGVAYRFAGTPRLNPYALIGFGAARVTNATTFSGADLSTVVVGTDLSGSFTRPFVTVGGGVHIPITGRWFGDASYRYGWVAKENDTASGLEVNSFSTNRLQFGFGARF